LTRLTIPEALQRAIALYQANRIDEAESLARLILQSAPGSLDTVNLLGAIALKRGDAASALSHFTRAIDLQPGFADAHSNRGMALRALGRPAEAFESLNRALAIRPGHGDALFNLALALGDLGRWPEALAAYDELLRIQPGHALAWSNRGNILQRFERWDEALAAYERAMELRADYVDARYNRASALLRLERRDEALAGYEEVLRLRPDHAEALFNRASLLEELGRWDEAAIDLERAVASRPEHVDARWNQALLFLLRGDYARGWPGYELRWEQEVARPFVERFEQPLWRGNADLAGKTILLHAEQGLGDTIQFSRYVPLVQSRAGRVILEVQPSLAALASSISPDVTVIARGAPRPRFDRHAPLGSLPLAFDTSIATIPPPTRLRIDERVSSAWKERLGERKRRRIGLTWSGDPEKRGDLRRSVALAQLEPLLAEERFEFHGVQKAPRSEDRERLARHPQVRLWSDELTDFMETAALLADLDLLITVDTSVAHLAATLGVPTWVLLPSVPDFRWMLERADSPWYPSVRLFRQARPDDWDAVIAEVREALRT